MCLSMTSYGDLCATGRCQGHGHGCNYLNLPLIPASGTQVLIFPLLLWFWNIYLYLMRQHISSLLRFLWTSAMPNCFLLCQIQAVSLYHSCGNNQIWLVTDIGNLSHVCKPKEIWRIEKIVARTGKLVLMNVQCENNILSPTVLRIDDTC